jgi:biopolymer transport protein ExbB/TolQ
MLETIAEHYHHGGVVMHFIATCSLFAMAIAWERFAVIRAASQIKKEELLSMINSFIMQGNLEKAIQVTSQVKSPLTNIVRAGLMAVANGKGEEEVQTAMDAVALKEIPKIERRIPLLSMISNLATLFGLLGTVIGMIGAFGAVANVSPAEKATMLSNSIAEALNATAFGLGTALPTLAAYGWFQSWASDVVSDIHEASVATLNFVLANKDKIREGR